MARHTLKSVTASVITEQSEVCYHTEHLDLGFCYSYELDGSVTVFCPDTTAQNWPSLEMAEEAIREGWHNVGQYCPVVTHESPVDEFGYTEWLISPLVENGYPTMVNPLNGLDRADGCELRRMGYDPDVHWVAEGGQVLTLDGDELVGNITERYQPPTDYLTEDEYHSHRHEMMF